jgi:hypothetical protein
VTAQELALNTTQPELGSTIEPVVVEALPEEVSGRGRQIDSIAVPGPWNHGQHFLPPRSAAASILSRKSCTTASPHRNLKPKAIPPTSILPSNWCDEYRVERSTFSAQFGLGQGALTYQMSSGTNTYHGDAFEINRNSFFDSVGFFNGPAWNSSNTKNQPPTDHENNYGFTIGGPIRIPHVYDGRNKTFGHYSQEWYKQNSEDTDTSTVPSCRKRLATSPTL